MPPRASKISPFTASTALSTPLPRKRALSPSRSSTASCAPVEAPDGTAARPRAPSSSTTSTSTVGLPRLSRISRPIMSTIAVMCGSPGCFRCAALVANELGPAKPHRLTTWHAQGDNAMPYVDAVLQPGETIRQVTTVSRVGYLRGLVTWLVAALVLALSPDESSPLPHFVGRGAALVVFL